MSQIYSNYHTIQERSTAEYKDKGSRFIALAYPIQEAVEVKKLQQQLKAEHHKAVHVCYAYRMGFSGENYRVNDDGEPSGSAGLPILGQIDSLQLRDIVVFVVRYFGGVLLGVPGLIKAYKTVTKKALSEAILLEKVALQAVSFCCSYSQLQEVHYLIKKYQATIIQQDLQQDCLLVVNIPIVSYNHFIEDLNQRMQVIWRERK